MSDTALSTLLSYINSFYLLGILIASHPSLTVNLSHREVRQLAFDHTASEHRAGFQTQAHFALIHYIGTKIHSSPGWCSSVD